MSLFVRSPTSPQMSKSAADALDELRISQQRERRGLLLGAHLRCGRRFRGERIVQVLRLQLFELEQHAPEIVLDDLFSKAQLRRCLRGEGARAFAA